MAFENHFISIYLPHTVGFFGTSVGDTYSILNRNAPRVNCASMLFSQSSEINILSVLIKKQSTDITFCISIGREKKDDLMFKLILVKEFA